MPDEAEVKALTDEYRKLNLKFNEPPKVSIDTIGCWRSGNGYLTEESAEALARVVLERVEERERQSKRVRPGEYPTNPEEIEED